MKTTQLHQERSATSDRSSFAATNPFAAVFILSYPCQYKTSAGILRLFYYISQLFSPHVPPVSLLKIIICSSKYLTIPHHTIQVKVFFFGFFPGQSLSNCYAISLKNQASP